MKNTFQKGLKPENHIEYPLTAIPKPENGRIVCPKIGKQHKLNFFDFDMLPYYFREVTTVRDYVKNNIYPQYIIDAYYPFKGQAPKGLTQILKMEGLSEDNPKGCANVVHMDSPSDMPKAVVKWLSYQNVTLKKTDGHIDFLSFFPDTEEQITDGVKRALTKAFEAKYFFGVLRPEEYFERLTGGVGKLITEYPEGCPLHPSYPAGHGAAAAGGVAKVIERFNLSELQLKEILDTAYLWAMFRTFAGVHYSVDNVAGLWLGGLGKYFTKEKNKAYEL